MITEVDVLKALSTVMDPDLGRDIVSLGFVKNLVLDASGCSFDVELTSPACPVKEQLKQQCVDQVSALGLASVSVNMTAKVRQTRVLGKNQVSGVANLVAVASGKGGVGKSTIAVNLALALSQTGARVGVLDCDLYGPSLPAVSGIRERARGDENNRIVPLEAFGMPMMSMGFLMDQLDAVTWRGPMLHKMLAQFLFGVNWGELDYLILDLPPGTGDVQLSLTEIAPIAGAVLVTTPQKVALRDVVKGLEMFKSANVPVLGIVENMSFYICPKCGEQKAVFPGEGGRKLAETHNLPLLGQIPLERRIPGALGSGEPLMLREKEGPVVAAFRSIAGSVVSELSRNLAEWAQPGPDAMEV